MSDDPTKEQTVKVFEEIMERLAEAKSKPIQTKFLVVFLMIGHGVFRDGSLSIYFNEFDHQTKFYWSMKMENHIKSFYKTIAKHMLWGYLPRAGRFTSNPK